MYRHVRVLVIVLAVSVLLVGSTSPLLGSPRQSSTVHVVQWGESLSIIAAQYGVTVNAIAEANGISNPNFVYAGQRLVIPAGAVPASPSGPTSTYVVQRGDTLRTIASRYGTTVTNLASWNSLWNPDFIYVGQVLRVPGEDSPAPPTQDSCIHWVKTGDTLTRIALQYRTTVWAMAIANNLANPSFIWVGQRLVVPGCSQSPVPSPTPVPPTPVPTPPVVGRGPKAVIIVIWDGTQRAHLLEMLNGGQLPNLAAFIQENQPLVWPVIKTQTCQPGSEAGYRTETGPANSAIATGLGFQGMGNWTNTEPHPIPDGRTLWEWFKARGYATGIVSSKDEPFWPNTTLNNARGDIDYWKVEHQPQAWVTDNALTFIRTHAASPFFLWVHYREPDTLGHQAGENSAEYTQSLVIDDQQFARIVSELRARDMLGETLLILTTDHGFNEGGTQHDTCTADTKDLFLAANRRGSALSGCIRYQTDIAPCIWALY
jgi:LysM repeat protein